MEFWFRFQWYLKHDEVNGYQIVRTSCESCKPSGERGWRKQRLQYRAAVHHAITPFGRKAPTPRTYICDYCGAEETAKETA